MNEANISPLARRLAEENSIDWRQLQGSGPDGRVVERDVLMYLARIMSGEADLPTQPDAELAADQRAAADGDAAPDHHDGEAAGELIAS